MKYTSEIVATCKDGATQCEFVKFGSNKAGEEILVKLSRCDLSGSIGKVWKTTNRIGKEIKDYISVDVYATGTDGLCCGKYNPQHKPNKAAPVGCVIDFEWVLPWTSANREKILAEVYRRANFEED